MAARISFDFMDVEPVVGRAIRRLRLERGLSQESLAFDVGIAARHLGRIERGTISVTIGVLARIATALACRLADLFNEADRPMPPNLPRGRSVAANLYPDQARAAPLALAEPEPPRWQGADPDLKTLRSLVRGEEVGKYRRAAETMIAELIEEAGGEDRLTERQRENIRLARTWAATRDAEEITGR